MTYRLYITPVIGTGASARDPRRPKYFDGLRWAGMDYGLQPIFLVAADLEAATDSSIIAQPDVTEFPFDLNPNLSGGQVNNARSALEAALIPAQWVNAQMTWRQVARMVAGMFQYMQRLNYWMGNEVLIDDGTKLNVQWQTVPIDIQDDVLQAAHDLGYDTSFIQPNTQVRQILEVFAGSWGTQTFQLNEFIF